jgi:hypothetical protein
MNAGIIFFRRLTADKARLFHHPKPVDQPRQLGGNE